MSLYHVFQPLLAANQDDFRLFSPFDLSISIADHAADSIKYLTLSQATALNFLAPMGAMILSKYMDHGTFNFIDRAGAVIALAGVVMVIQPDNIFQPGETLPLGPKPDTFAKLKGLGCGIVGILGTVVSREHCLRERTSISEARSDVCWTIDRSDHHATDRISLPSSYHSQLLCMGCLSCCCEYGDHRASKVANDFQRLVVHGHRGSLWRSHGESKGFNGKTPWWIYHRSADVAFAVGISPHARHRKRLVVGSDNHDLLPSTLGSRPGSNLLARQHECLELCGRGQRHWELGTGVTSQGDLAAPGQARGPL